MRTAGAMPSITPLQMATASSSVPKSVMKTMTGAGETPGLPAGTSPALAADNPADPGGDQNQNESKCASCNSLLASRPSKPS